MVPSASSSSVTAASGANVFIVSANQGVRSGLIQNTRSASCKAAASEGRRLYSCGLAPGFTIREGVPTPFMTLATKECTGAMSTATRGVAADAVPPINAADRVRVRSFLDIGVST